MDKIPKPLQMQNPSCALVIGLCSHGLATARSLHHSGIDVHALESKKYIPGVRTNCAKIHFVESIKSNSLIIDLINVRRALKTYTHVVLFASSDDHVRLIAENIKTLSPLYKISWQTCSEKIVRLLEKSSIENLCLSSKTPYPKSLIVKNTEQLYLHIKDLASPFIIKPVMPQSAFKAIKCTDPIALEEVIENNLSDSPFIVQEWVPGTDRDIFFCALYLHKGIVIDSLCGKKLESYPPALGQTTVAVTQANSEIKKLTQNFFNGLNLSGPVSLELKRDEKGKYWVIEPTVGRTDFWLGLCTVSGFNIPYLEYHGALNRIDKLSEATQTQAIWFDSERDPLAPLRYWKKIFLLEPLSLKKSFSYFNKNDLMPFFGALKIFIYNKLTSRKIEDIHIAMYHNIETIPEKFKTLLRDFSTDPFSDYSWLKNFHETIASKEGNSIFLCVKDTKGHALAILPLWQIIKKERGVKVNLLKSMTNYYSPIFDIVFNNQRIKRKAAYQSIHNYLKKNRHLWDVFELSPMSPESEVEFNQACIRSPKNSSIFARNHFIVINGTYTDYLKNRPSKLTNTIKRKEKKLSEHEKWQITIVTQTKDLNSIIEDYWSVYNASWKNKEPYKKFIENLIIESHKNGSLRLGCLKINDHIAAIQLWIKYKNTTYIYKLAYNQKYKIFSPGTLLTNALIKYSIDTDKAHRIDFLTGNEAYKKDWMDASRILYRVRLYNYKSFKGLYLYLVNSISKCKEIIASFYTPKNSSR